MQKENNKISNYSDIDSNYSHPKREEYLRFSANIKYFLGLKISSNEFISLMKTKHINRSILKDGVCNETVNINGLKLPNKSSMFVTLHLGCYNIIPWYLLTNGIKLCIPVTQRVYNEQKSIYENSFAKFIKKNNADLKFVNIETTSGFINLLRSVKNGYSLLIYIDGNSGIGGMERKDNKLMKIDFFNNSILIRKGIGFLSLKLGLDIIPIYTNITEDLQIHNLTLMPSFSPQEFENEEQVLTTIWKIFKSPIFHNIGQWEPWLYADSYYIQVDNSIDSYNTYVFNSERFAPIIKNGRYYFYDNILNMLIQMKESTFKFLVNVSEKSQTIKAEELDKNISPFVKSQLISMHLLKQ